MENTAERIASLPPEKREILLRRLREQFAPKLQSERPAPQRERRLRVIPEGQINTRLSVAQPGILDTVEWRQVTRQAPGPGEVEIQVHAAGLNFRDVMIALGIYPTPPGMPPIMGSDCAGTIVAVGDGVCDLRVGDEVMALCANSFSGFVTASAPTVVRKPSRLTFEQAAAIPTIFVTDWYALHHLARLAPGERILIHSAAGGVGLAAIQMAQWIGAEVFATVGTDEKREFIKNLGVQHVMNSRSLEFAEDILKVTGDEGVDVILNSLAGEAIPKGLSVLRPLGRFIELGKRDIYGNSPIGLLPFFKGLSFFAIELSPLIKLSPEVFQDMFLEIATFFDKDIFKPLPMHVVPAAEIADAFKYMAQGVHIGKIVVTIKDQPVSVQPESSTRTASA